MIPHVNLSISGYELDSLRTSSMRSLPMWAQEVSAIPQVDGPGSLPMRDPIGRWMHGVSSPVEQDSSQGGTYVQRASGTKRREYPGGDSNNDGSRRPYRDQRPPDRGSIQTKVGDPLTKEDTLMRPLVMEDPLEEDILIGMGDPLEEEDTLIEMKDLLVMEDPLDLLMAKDHQALKDHLDQ